MRLAVCFAIAALAYLPTSHAQSLRIAVASNFKHSLEQILQAYPQQLNTSISSASSGVLYQQIKLGAPFDLYLAANQRYPNELFQQQQCSRPQTYARGQLTLWVNDGKGKRELLHTPQQIEKILNDNGTQNLVMANPKLAPYGLAAQQILAGITRGQGQTITANNIQQAWQYLQSGAAFMGLIATAQVKQYINKNSAYSLDARLYQPILQQLCIPAQSKQTTHTKKLIQFILSSPEQLKLQQQGYTAFDEP